MPRPHEARPVVLPSPQSRSALAAYVLLLGGAGAALFLAGGAEQGSLGVFLLCAGVALVACPPRVPVEGRLWAAAAAWLGWGILAFSPAHWWPAPAWRQTLAGVPAVVLPGSVTAQPGATAFWLGMLAISLVTGLFALTQPVRSRGMTGLVCAAVAVCAGYAALAIYARVSGWKYPFSGGATFGFLPNRNHSATLLVTGSLLALGLMSTAFRDRRWLLADAALAGGLLCVVGLFFFSESRAGVIFLGVGGILWLSGLGEAHRGGRIWVVCAAVVIVAGGLFLAIKSPVRDRLLGSAGIRTEAGSKAVPPPPPTPSTVAASAGAVASARVAVADPPSEFRSRIYRDALAMIRDQPWTGSGLGTFAGVFPQYRRASLSQYVALHPESDWLMLAAEMGLPAVACAAVLVGLTAGRLRRGTRLHPYWPLRWGCLAAAAAAALHGAVDVPTHRAALGWWVLVLAALGLQQATTGRGGRQEEGESRTTATGGAGEKQAGSKRRWPGVAQRVVFIVTGVAALALGGQLVRAEWFRGEALAPFAADEVGQRMFDDYRQKKYTEGTALGWKTIREAPLAASAYYYLGIFLALSDAEGVDNQVDDMFQAQRVLDPIFPDIPLQQAAAWAGYDPARQAALFMQALARQSRCDRLMGHGEAYSLSYYRNRLSEIGMLPDVQKYLLGVTRPDAAFGQSWKQTVGPRLVQDWGQVRLDEDARSADRALVTDWYAQPANAEPVFPAKIPAGEARGDDAPEWLDAAWAVRLRQRVYAGKYEEAVGQLRRRYGISLELPVSTEAGGDDQATSAFVAAWCGGKQEEARRVLEEARVDEDDPASLEIWRWQAALAAHDGKWREAWRGLERYVRHTRQTEWP